VPYSFTFVNAPSFSLLELGGFAPMTILFYAPLETLAQPTGTGVYISNLLKALLEIDQSNRYIVWHFWRMKSSNLREAGN